MWSYRSYKVGLLLTALAVLLGMSAYYGPEDAAISLKDFDYVVSGVRAESTITRQTVSSSLLTGFDYEEFKPEDGISVITVRLKARKSGEINLACEMFIMHKPPFYELCQGIKVVEPKPQFCEKGFTPPRGGGSVTTLQVTEGQSLVLELAFQGKLNKGQRLLVATPQAELPASTPTEK